LLFNPLLEGQHRRSRSFKRLIEKSALIKRLNEPPITKNRKNGSNYLGLNDNLSFYKKEKFT